MTEGTNEGGSGEIEYLDTAPGESTGSASGTSRRWGPIIGLTVGGLVVAGGAAYGIAQFLGGGASAAQAVPADAFGYLGVDMDPGADQQIAAYRFLKKFPAIEDELDLGSDEDLRKEMVEAILADAPCDDLTWADDFEPWLGNSAAVAGRMGDDGPEPYFLLNVKDEGKARDAVDAITACGEQTEETAGDYGIAFSDDFMVIAEDEAKAKAFVSDAADSSLADDSGYQERVDAVGGEGFVTGYLAPSAGQALVDGLKDMEQAFGSDFSGEIAGRAPALTSDSLVSDGEDPSLDMGPSVPGLPDTKQLEEAVKDFKGAAMSVRFEDGALEVRATSAGIKQTEAVADGESGVQDLPATTAFAFGLPVADDFVEKVLDGLSQSFGDEMLDSMLGEFESQTGLDARTDLQPLLGDGLAIALDDSADFESLSTGSEEAVRSLPVGLRIHGDPSTIEPAVEKVLAAFPIPPDFVAVEAGDDAVAIGPDPDYVSTLAGDGDLGGQDGFGSALPDFDENGPAMYVDLNGDWLTTLLEADDSSDAAEVRANVEPLKSMGFSGSVDGDEATLVFRLATD